MAKLYDHKDGMIKKFCKEKLDKAMAGSFYEDLCVLTWKSPPYGLYFTRLFCNFIGVAFLLRCIDAVTDITISCHYLSEWNASKLQFPNKTACDEM